MELLIVMALLLWIIAFENMHAISYVRPKLSLWFDIWHNFTQIGIKCDSDYCNTITYCPLNFDGKEIFDGTIDSNGAIKTPWDVRNYPNLIDLSKFVTNNNWTHQDLDYDNQGRVNDETTNFDQFLKHQWCTKKVYNDYDLTDFYDSLKHTTWEADPKMYLINWVLYTKNFIPIKSAIDLDSKTYIINWIVYYNY